MIFIPLYCKIQKQVNLYKRKPRTQVKTGLCGVLVLLNSNTYRPPEVGNSGTVYRRFPLLWKRHKTLIKVDVILFAKVFQAFLHAYKWLKVIFFNFNNTIFGPSLFSLGKRCFKIHITAFANFFVVFNVP
jgi:hypothetical protein